MDYEDDELERMRVRREQRRNGGRSAERERTRRSSGGSSSTSFKSGYNGPRSGSGSGKSSNKRRRGPDKKKRIMIIVAEVLILVLLVVGAAGWYIYERTFGSLQKIEFDESNVANINLTNDQLAGMKGYLNIACFGVDSRSVGGKMNVGKGTNADVNLICSVNMETGEIRLVSIFRDTYLNINDKNSYNKINAAYASGGPEQAVKALNKNLGLNITQFATFNWKAVADAINILDGVDIEISENELSWINAYITETVKETGIGSVQLKNSGLVHMDGVQAVAYGRLRLGDTDYARTERQRIVMQKAFEKAKTADWAVLNNIIETVMPQLATNVKPTDLIPLARNISKYHIGETSGFPSARGEGNIGKLDCVIPQTLESNVKELHRFLFGAEDYKLPDNVKEYSKHISEASGLYKEAKHIGHVPVDQGLNASTYVNRKQKKAEVRETEKVTEESGTEESTEETTESSTEESSAADSSESSTWDDGWDDEEWEDWEDGPEATGPGTGPGSGPGMNSPTQPGNKIPNDKNTATTAGDNSDATGPGRTPTESPTRSPSATGGDKNNTPITPTTSSTPTTPTTAAGNPLSPADSGKTNNSDKTNNSGKTNQVPEGAGSSVTGPGA